MKITFKAKSYINALGKETIATPKKITKQHVVNGSLSGEKWDGIINSDLLPRMISRAVEKLRLNFIHPESLPNNITIDDGFLKQVTIDLGSTY